jgi:hypothetical protein
LYFRRTHVVAEQDGVAVVGAAEAHHQIHQCGFARAVRADEGADRAFRDVQ